MTIPTRGLCYSVFILTYLAKTKVCENRKEWVDAAREVPTIMTSALALEPAAIYLENIGLASIGGSRVVVEPRLVAAGETANTTTLAAIAKVLMGVDPPGWLTTAVFNDELRWEFVPTSDGEDLAWLEDLLVPLLCDLRRSQDESEEFRSWLGKVGENLVVASEEGRGRDVRQVSLISDAFGFDIESRSLESRYCLEVKTTLESRSDTFFITKNETRKAAEIRDQWKLIQVVLTPVAITQEQITAAHVREVRALDASTVLSLLPIDTDTGIWIETAEISPPRRAWTQEALHLPEDWLFPGYRIVSSH